VIVRLRALRSLRWNYKRRGVWVWLKGFPPVPAISERREHLVTCPGCNGSPRRGYQRILSEPAEVIAEQTALAEGAFA
jgi:hypothetical protein